jgi:hypothetical protein
MSDTVTALTVEAANDILDRLKFWPFGTSHSGAFYIEEAANPDNGDLFARTLHMRKMGFDSRAWNFGDEDDSDLYEDNIDIENLHTQDFQINLRHSDLDDEEALLHRVCELVAYAMAHEGLEWLRHADGTLVHDPHTDSDVQVTL